MDVADAACLDDHRKETCYTKICKIHSSALSILADSDFILTDVSLSQIICARSHLM